MKKGLGVGAIVIMGLIIWWLSQKAKVAEALSLEPIDLEPTEKELEVIVIGGSPVSAGYQYDSVRGGWYRPGQPEASFIPASQKPEWDVFIL